MDEKTPTLGDFLRELCPQYDLSAWSKSVDTVIQEAPRRLAGVLEPLGELAQQVMDSPPSPGYEPLLLQHGQHPIVARMLARLLVRVGVEEANDVRRLRDLWNAIRFLAKPGRNKDAITRKAAIVLAALDQTFILDKVFRKVGLSVQEFAESLGAAIGGDECARRRVTEIAAVVAPKLSVPRGPKPSAASIAHELLLSQGKMTGQTIYTWDVMDEDFTDPVTRATRLAFNDWDFDPRSARRRQRAHEAAIETTGAEAARGSP